MMMMVIILTVTVTLAGGVPRAGAAEGPVLLVDQHVDLRIRYDAASTNLLDVLAANDDVHPTQFLESTNCILVAAEQARLELPADIPPLGSAGDPLWVLPASQQPGLLYLGLSGEGAPGGVFAEPFRLRLLEVEGPGHFFLWQAELGGLEFRMNTRDGIGPDDVFTQLVGGHSHADWGFTTSGVYRVTFQAESRRLGETTNIFSPPRTFTFHVLPLPPEPETPFRRWQELHWPGLTDTAVIGEAADPDGDGQANLWEYVLATDPKVPDAPAVRVPGLSVAPNGGEPRAVIRTVRAAPASDAGFRLWTADRPGGAWSRLEVEPEVSDALEGWVSVSFRDPRPVASRAESFYRLEAVLEPQP